MDVKKFSDTFKRVREELERVVVGQEKVIEHLLVAVFGGGHILLTGVPGLGRTLLVKSLGQAMGLDYRRLQFTSDLLPTDILGAEVLEGGQAGTARRFRFFKGPVFANLVLADEINRSPSRTQSALLEVMQERQATVGGQTYFLPKPFILIATQNTTDSDGIWPLGEAQADRFMMCIEQFYPNAQAEERMLELTTGKTQSSAQPVTTPEEVLAMQRLARDVPVVPGVKNLALSIVRASRPNQSDSVKEVQDDIRLGGSPRAAQALLLGAKVMALANGRTHVTQHDVLNVARPVMAHRMLLDFRAQARGHDAHFVLDTILARVKERAIPDVSMWTRDLLKRIQ
jgi:MoxR-like ATPase